MSADTESAWDRRDDALRLSSRVILLFGPESDPVRRINGFLHRLADGVGHLPPSPGKPTNLPAAKQALQAASDAHDEFVSFAHAAVRLNRRLLVIKWSKKPSPKKELKG
jgi:hypothetical protein